MAKQSKEKQSKKSGPITWIFLGLIFLCPAIIESVEDMEFSPVVIIIITFILILIISMCSIKKKNQAEEGRNSASSGHRYKPASGIGDRKTDHTHDRLSTSTIHPESGMEHWKHQLDGFLASGIIDKKEHKVLMEKYSREL